MLVPERALGTDQEGKYLLIVGPKDIVEKRPVKIGVQEGNLRVIEENLKPEELVIINGLQKARPDAQVKPKLTDLNKPAVAAVTRTPQT